MTFAQGRTATITPQTANRDGDRTPGDPLTVSGCAFWQTPGTQSVVGQDTIVSEATLLVPFGTAVDSTDRITVDGVTYEVSSQPIPWKSDLTGWEACIEVHLRHVDG